MRKWLNNYLELSRRTYNGLLAMVFVIGILSIVPAVYRKFQPEPLMTAEEREAVIQLLLSDTDDGAGKIALIDVPALTHAGKVKSLLFHFDPNVIDMDDWVKLGLSEKQARGVMNYRKKGGKFYKAEDLQKMYTISEVMYQRLLPYISIASDSGLQKAETVSDRKRFRSQDKKPKLVDLNRADTLELDELRGIGAVFAKRIAKYRDRLGGFYRKEQLFEVFGFDSARYEMVMPQIIIDTLMICRININTASYEDFKKHPYLRYKQINAIVEYRRQHGAYRNIDDLHHVAILSGELIEKMRPYLSF